VVLIWPPVLLLILVSGERGGCDGFGGSVGEAEASSFRVGPWRIKGTHDGSGGVGLLDLVALVCWIFVGFPPQTPLAWWLSAV
jgi:hypothetical protein